MHSRFAVADVWQIHLRHIAATVVALVAISTQTSCKRGAPTPSPTASGSIAVSTSASAPIAPREVMADCDGDPKNGKETNTDTNAQNCGACGYICNSAHSTTTCVKGGCTPTCDDGYDVCGRPAEGCLFKLANDPRACGACGNSCHGAPCIDMSCVGVELVVKDIPTWSLSTADDTWVYFRAPSGLTKYTRVKILGGTKEEVDATKLFLPSAYDGKDVYGCQKLEGECELVKRHGDGAPTTLLNLKGILLRILDVRDGAVVWFRRTGNKVPVTGEIVETSLTAPYTEVIHAREQLGVWAVTLDTSDVFWVTFDQLGITTVHRSSRKAAAKGTVDQSIVTTLPIGQPSDLVLDGEFVYVVTSAADVGISRAKKSGGESERFVVGLPDNAGLVSDAILRGFVVTSNHFYWTMSGKDGVRVRHLVRSPKPEAKR